MQQLQFELCRFCHATYSVEDEHYCVGLDRSRSQSWSRIFRYLAGLAEWFEVEASARILSRQLDTAQQVRSEDRRSVWTVEIRCRKCGAPYSVCEPPGYGDPAFAIQEHRIRCFPRARLSVVKAPRGRRKEAKSPGVHASAAAAILTRRHFRPLITHQR